MAGEKKDDIQQPTSVDEVSTVFPLVSVTKENVAEVGRLVDVFKQVKALKPTAGCCKHTWER